MEVAIIFTNIAKWILKKVKRLIVRFRNKQKVFVIGFNKTGTTSIQAALGELGYILGDQASAERLLKDVMQNNYKPLLDYCCEGEAFQDVPFSIPGVYKVLDSNFKGSKFILSVRNDSDQWFLSLLNFHKKVWTNGEALNEENINKAKAVYKNYGSDFNKCVFGEVSYEPQKYKKVYEEHNEAAKAYFKNRADDFLVLNTADETAYKKMTDFLGKKPKRDSFEWKNKT